MEKLYTKTITKCSDCPNMLRVPSISPHVIHEMRCKASRYRKNAYRLIHWDMAEGIPQWCPLPNTEKDIEFHPYTQ